MDGTNPGRELTDQFKEQGWAWRPNDSGKPWVYRLEKSSEFDPTARGDSRDALHEQFLLILQEYRVKHGMPPTLGWESMAESDTKGRDKDRGDVSSSPVVEPAVIIVEEQIPQPTKQEARGGSAGDARRLRQRGAARFDVTFTDAGSDKVGFRGNRSLGQLRAAIPAILQAAADRRHNVIVRPRSTGTELVQLDDLGEDAVERLRPVSFLVQRTSPGNCQAWVAVADGDADFARRLRRGAGGDLGASGASRISGSLNFKEKYAPLTRAWRRSMPAPARW